MSQPYFNILLLLLIGFNLSACMGGGQAPVYSREKNIPDAREAQPVAQKIIPRGDPKGQLVVPKAYRIVKGDTLYSIAFRYGLDYKKLADWNAITSPYVIKVGQKLRLQQAARPPLAKTRPSTSTSTSTAQQTRKRPKPTNNSQQTIKDKKPKTASKQKNNRPDPLPKVVKWQWPVKGKLIRSNSVSASNGIDIKGKKGQKVKAAATGDVVHSSNALVGYGNLVIIKHNDNYLSAYAHNDRLLVGEGARVKTGQVIAEMGDTGTNQVKLHFEIRKEGKSVNPLEYLPK